MTRRERVIAAVKHEQLEFAPYNISMTHQEYEKVAAYLGDVDFVSKIGHHISDTYYDGYLNELAPGSGYWKDDL